MHPNLRLVQVAPMTHPPVQPAGPHALLPPGLPYGLNALLGWALRQMTPEALWPDAAGYLHRMA